MIRLLLAALIEDALARLPHEPNLHDKRLLGQHAHENAQALADLGGPQTGELPEGDPRDLLLDELRAASADDPQLAVLLRRQERHALELPPKLIETPAQTVPARDPFVEIGEERPGPHAELNQALILAEVAAASVVEVADKSELAALAAAKLDETAEIERTLPAPWGSEPVDVSAYERLMALPLPDRLEQLRGQARGSDEDPGS